MYAKEGKSNRLILKIEEAVKVEVSMIPNLKTSIQKSMAISIYFSNFEVQFNSVMSDSLRHHELQHARLPCPSPTPGAYSNSCPLSWRCHQTISASVVPFSSCLQSFPVSGSFPRVITSHQVAKVLEFQLQHVFPMSIQD